MNEPINHIGNIASPGDKTLSRKPAERSGSDAGRDISKTSSEYILSNNKIVFERYDRQGKLISRVPWTANTIDENA